MYDKNNWSDMLAGKSGQPSLGRLEIGKVYPGVITECNHGDNLYTVAVDGMGITMECLWTPGAVFAPMLGMRTMYYPPLQSRVLVLACASTPHYIVQSVPSEQFNGAAALTKTMTGIAANELAPFVPKQDGRGLEVNKPTDLLEGEFCFANNFGVAIQLLTTLASMKGSERAKVETFLLNDMVRIVSDTFKHFSSFGDFQIYNDGRLNTRWDGTSYEHEAWGLEDPKTPKAEVTDRQVEPADKFNETGRWRFSQFVGFLGDFIHTFVTEPNATLASIAEEALRPGKSAIHANSDGSIILQSVADIVLERVVRVITPVEKKRYDDPGGNKVADFENLDEAYLKIWNYGTNLRNAHYTSYQLRQYARWLSCFHSYARFHQLDKDWKIPKETDEETQHAWTNKEADVETANPLPLDETYQDVYSTIRIMRDGSILVMDSFGSAISMVRGNIQLSAPRHIDIDAAGDIRMTAGQNIYMKARRNIEIVSIVGGLVLKARTWFKALCEWGTVHIKSDAVDPQQEDPPSPDDAEQDPEPEVHAAAIILETSKGQMVVQAERRMTIGVTGTPDDEEDIEDTTASIVIQSRKQDVRMLSQRNSIIKIIGSKGKLILDAATSKAIIIKCLKLLVSATKLFDIDNRFTLKPGGILNVSQIRAEQGHFASVVTGPEFTGKLVNPGSPPPFKPHGEHMRRYDEERTPIELGGDTEERDDYSSSSIVPATPYEDNGEGQDGPDWKFVQEEMTFNDSGFAAEPVEDETFQPMAQQRLAETGDDNLITKDDYDLWSWNTYNKLKDAPRTDSSSLPFPGLKAKEKIHTGGQPLHLPLDEEYSAQSPDTATDMTDADIERKFLKLK